MTKISTNNQGTNKSKSQKNMYTLRGPLSAPAAVEGLTEAFRGKQVIRLEEREDRICYDGSEGLTLSYISYSTSDKPAGLS